MIVLILFLVVVGVSLYFLLRKRQKKSVKTGVSDGTCPGAGVVSKCEAVCSQYGYHDYTCTPFCQDPCKAWCTLIAKQIPGQKNVVTACGQYCYYA